MKVQQLYKFVSKKRNENEKEMKRNRKGEKRERERERERERPLQRRKTTGVSNNMQVTLSNKEDARAVKMHSMQTNLKIVNK